jgi:hypothetical protein
MTTKKDMFKVGQICPTSGIYRIKTCKCLSKQQYEIPLVKGKTFPPCRNCDFEVVWEFVRSA